MGVVFIRVEVRIRPRLSRDAPCRPHFTVVFLNVSILSVFSWPYTCYSIHYPPDYHTVRFNPGRPFFIERSRKKRGGAGVLDYVYVCLYPRDIHRYGVSCIYRVHERRVATKLSVLSQNAHPSSPSMPGAAAAPPPDGPGGGGAPCPAVARGAAHTHARYCLFATQVCVLDYVTERI